MRMGAVARGRPGWTELERRCRRDATTWYVQPSTVRRPWRLRWRWPRRLRQANTAYIASVDARRQAAEACPTCGSSDYDEHRVTTLINRRT
jgi:hypothetical protein